MFSICLNGYIPIQKSKEFKQHLKQLIGLHNSESFNLYVFQDMMIEDLYQVKITFKDKESLFSFMKSDDYAMISGSFKVLGVLREQHFEKYTNFKDRQELIDE